MKHTVKEAARTAAMTAAAVTAASMTSFAATKYMVRMALDREPPKAPEAARRLIAGAIPHEKFFKAVTEAGEKLAAKPNETVEIKASDGTPLVGHWRPVPNTRRALVAMHGWRSTWYGDFGLIADFWEKNGCSVLYAEQRGQNNSGGEYMGFGLMERYDCLDWVRWVNSRTGAALPIYLCGVSMGATSVLMAAGLDLPGNVHGIAGDCGFTSPDAIWRHIANDNLHIPYGLRSMLVEALVKKKIQVGPEDYSTVDALSQSRIPVLLIHGTDDSFVPVEMSFENYKACAGPKRIFVVPGADHGMSYYVDREGYEAAARDFWQQFD